MIGYSLLIGCPTMGKPCAEFSMDSFGHLMYHIGRKHPEISPVWVQRDVRTYRQTARQGIVEAALEQNVSHLLMLDDDHTFEGSQFTKIWEAMLTHVKRPKMLAALYFTRSSQCAPCIFRHTREGTVPIFYYPDDDDIHEVDVVGFGFTLFDLDVFRRMNPPWFNLGNDFGEDAAFCARMKHAGFMPHVHTGVKIGHILENPQVVGEQDYVVVREGLERDRAAKRAAGIEVGESQLVPVPGASGGWREGEMDSGYVPQKTRRDNGRRRWWQPNPGRLWKRDANIFGVARKEPTGSRRQKETSPDETSQEIRQGL